LGLAAQAFDADDILDMEGASLSAELIEMRRGIDRLEAQFSRRLVRFDVTRGYEREGAADLISWLRWACRMGTGAAARRLHLARQLTELPDTEAAWRSGAISTGHATVIGRTVDEMGEDGAHAAEPALLEAAGQMNPGHTSVTLYAMTVTATATIRAAIYTRISSDPDATHLGVNRQEQDCRELADRRGWEGCRRLRGRRHQRV
jgi:hypothetical protein